MDTRREEADLSIGDWSFDPRAGELRRGGECRRLEDRAARALSLLVRRRGDVVSASEIVGEVWGGRSLSPNSVAVIIGDLRRALGDEARSPRYIETLPKRGYRLLPDAARPAADARPGPRAAPRMLAGAVAVGLAAALTTGTVWRVRTQAPPSVVVGDLANVTGDRAYDPLTRASSELVVTQVTRAGGLRVHRAGAGGGAADYELTGKLTLWNGAPSVTLSARDPKTRAVVWSYVAAGPAERLPQQIRDGAREFSGFAAGRDS